MKPILILLLLLLCNKCEEIAACNDIQYGITNKLISDVNIINSQTQIELVKSSSVDFEIEQQMERRQLDADHLVDSSIRTSIAWIVFTGVSLVTWISFCICYACRKSCPGLRRDTNLNPYSNCEMLTMQLLIAIFASIVIGASIAGLMFQSDLLNGIKHIRCSTITAMNDLIDPNTKQKGLEDLKVILQGLSGQIMNFTNETTALFNHNRTNDIEGMRQDLITSVNALKKRVVMYNITPDGKVVEPYESYFSRGQVLNFMIGQAFDITVRQKDQLIDMGIGIQSPVAEVFYLTYLEMLRQVENNALPFNKSGDSFQKQIDSGITEIDDVIVLVKDYEQQFDEQTQIVIESGEQASKSSVAVLTISLITSGLLILGIIGLIICNYNSAKYLLHFGWCVYCIVMILGFVLVSFIHPALVMTAELCQYADKMLYEEAFYLQSTLIKNNQVKDIVHECVYGQGEILKEFGVLDNVNKIRNMERILAEFQSFITVIRNNSQMERIDDVYSNNTKILQSVTDGDLIDQDYLAPSQQNIQLRINSVNEISSGLGCIQLKKSCGDQENCWTPVDLINNNILQACPDQREDLNILQQWFQQQNLHWSPIVEYQKLAQKDQLEVASALNLYQDDIQKYIGNIMDFLKYVRDPEQGLVNEFSCSQMKDSIVLIYDSTCQYFFPQLYKTTICLLVISFAMLLGSIITFCGAIRVNSNKQKRVQSKY